MNEAIFRQRTSPFYPNATTQYEFGQTYRGVFLNQPIGSSRPYYKVRVPDEQQISIHGQSRKFYPYYWSGSGVNYENANNRETGVVFTQSNATATAVLKGQLMSNEQNGISSNSQRKLVRTSNGIYHLVYESQGSIWYTRSLTNNFNGEWTKDRLISGCYTAKNPSIDFLNNDLVIVYEFWDDFVKLKYLMYNTESDTIKHQTDFILSFDPLDFGIVKPVVAIVPIYQQSLIIYKKSRTSNLKYRTRAYFQNVWYWIDESDLPETDANSVNPTVISDKRSSEFHIAYQQGNISIRYMHANQRGDPPRPLMFCSFYNVSTGSGFERNEFPSISLFVSYYNPPSMWYQPIITWRGYRKYIAEKKTFNKENDVSMESYNVVVRPQSYLGWGSFFIAGDNVNFSHINSRDTINDGTVIVWSEENGRFTRWVRRENASYSNVSSLSHNGIQAHISNANNLNNMKAIVFNTRTSAPYLINLATTAFGGNVSKDNILYPVTYRRAAVVYLNNMEFLFNMGDIIVNNEIVKFIERADTLPVTSLSELNSIMRTNTFTLDRTSKFQLFVMSYSINSNFENNTLGDNEEINFQLELVNAQNNIVVGKFDKIKFAKGETKKSKRVRYLVNCSRIEPCQYYLRLLTNVQGDASYYLVNIQSYKANLDKDIFENINFDEEISSLDFRLDQNYPNPFNSLTKIAYSIKETNPVTIKLYDIMGREIATILNEIKDAGEYEIELDAGKLGISSGVYFYQMKAGDYTSIKKMVYLK